MSWDDGDLNPDTGRRSEHFDRRVSEESESSMEAELECDICGEGFEVMPALQSHVDEEHTEFPENREELHFLTCVNCSRKNFYNPDDPGSRDNVEVVEEDEAPVKITCECGEVIETW